MESKRLQKFNRLIQQDLGELFQRELKHIVEKAFLTVTEVKTTPDLGLCKVYLSIMLEEPKNVIKRLEENSGIIRLELGKKIKNQVRKIPDLRFYYDDTAIQASKMDQLFDNLDIPKDEDPT